MKKVVKTKMFTLNEVFFLKKVSKLLECSFESVPNQHKLGFTLVRFKKTNGIPYNELKLVVKNFKSKFNNDLLITNDKFSNIYSYSLQVLKHD